MDNDRVRIGDAIGTCEKCGWIGTVDAMQPDIDGDGSLGCPKCSAVIVVMCEAATTEKRRIAKVEITPEVLADYVRNNKYTHVVCIEGIPEDAEYVGVSIDPYSMRIMLFFTHESFDVIHQGEVVPSFTVVMKTIYDN